MYAVCACAVCLRLVAGVGWAIGLLCGSRVCVRLCWGLDAGMVVSCVVGRSLGVFRRGVEWCGLIATVAG